MEWGVFPVCSPPDSRGQTEARCPQTPSPPTFSSLKKDFHVKKTKKIFFHIKFIIIMS
jgi:hypothetical protein